MNNKKIKANFSPGIYPFWFWNAEIADDEIQWQIKQMAEQGCKGFYIHSRQGLKQPYLSDSFFSAVETSIAAADQYELSVNLYDEYPYPSGIAGGEVACENPAYLATKLVHDNFDTAGGRLTHEFPKGKILSCQAFPIHNDNIDWSKPIDISESVGFHLSQDTYYEAGLSAYTGKRYFACTPRPTLDVVLPAGKYRIIASIQILIEKHKYWQHFVDVLNPDAVDCFIRLTHERYRKRVGDLFGSRIQSIFGDETAPGWSPLLIDEYKKKYGKDLVSDLPALGDSEHPDHLHISAQLQSLKYDLFCENFEEKIASWCKKNNLYNAAEKAFMRFSQFKYFDIPGCDSGHTRASAVPDYRGSNLRQNARATASGAYFYDKEGALCECYHSLSWGATLLDLRLIADGLIQQGIRYLVPHAFFYSTHSLRKHDAPPSVFFQMPYWKYFNYLTARIERIWKYLDKTHIDAKVLIVDPSAGMPTEGMLSTYTTLMSALSREFRDYLILDADVLKDAVVENGYICIKEIKAELLVVPPMRIIEESLACELARLESEGAEIIRMDLDKTLTAEKIPHLVPPNIPYEILSGNSTNLSCVSRVYQNTKYWLIVNSGKEQVDFKFTSSANIIEIPLDDDIPSLIENLQDGLRRKILPFETVLLQDKGVDISIPPTTHHTVKIDNAVEIKLLSANLMRIGEWKMSLLDKDGKSIQEATVSAIPLSNQLADGKFAFAPDFQSSFGGEPEWRQPELSICYKYSFINEYSGAVELLMEEDSIVGDWSILLNGKGIGGIDDFTPTDKHIRGSKSVYIHDMLQIGDNVLEVFVKTDKMEGGLVNPLYLYGDFGVFGESMRLTELKNKGEFHSWRENGLPYFSGHLQYNSSFDVNLNLIEKDVVLELLFPCPFEDACEVSINAGPWHVISWAPYRVSQKKENLCNGENNISIRVATPLLQAFEGQKWNVIQHRNETITTTSGSC